MEGKTNETKIIVNFTNTCWNHFIIHGMEYMYGTNQRHTEAIR